MAGEISANAEEAVVRRDDGAMNVDLMCDSPKEGAEFGLLALMAGISEECWRAGWMDRNEFACWKAAETGLAQDYGLNGITARQAQLLKLLSEEAGGWWVFDNGLKFIRLDEWEFLR